jgi:hypothetical protein
MPPFGVITGVGTVPDEPATLSVIAELAAVGVSVNDSWESFGVTGALACSRTR